jgi:hypothetical protein
MLTRDEVVQLILYLIVATVLLLASRVRAETLEPGAGSDMFCADSIHCARNKEIPCL